MATANFFRSLYLPVRSVLALDLVTYHSFNKPVGSPKPAQAAHSHLPNAFSVGFDTFSDDWDVRRYRCSRDDAMGAILARRAKEEEVLSQGSIRH